MSSSVVKQGQNFLDKVIETTGNWENALPEAIKNGISITESLEVGTKLLPGTITNRQVVNIMRTGGATKYILSNEEVEQQGIEFWVIEQNFIVS